MRPLTYILFIVLLAFASNTAKASIAIEHPSKDSTFVTYHENGEVKEKGKYRNGEKHGRWTTYDTNGAVLKVVKYKKGKFWWERLYKKGKLSKVTDRKGNITKMKDCGC